MIRRTAIVCLLLAVACLLPGVAIGQNHMRVLFVGNSITWHSPYGIHAGTWGMAASAADKDYVHRVQLAIAARTGTIPEIAIARWDVGWNEDAALDLVADFAPDVIVVQVGDNAGGLSHDEYVDTLSAFLRAVRGNRMVVLTGVWYSVERERWSAEVAAQVAGVRFVPIQELYSGDTIARIDCQETDPVCSHPGDLGMAAIAERIIAEMLGKPTAVYLPQLANP